MKYTYGTSNKAASRLEEISKFFNPLADKFIKQYLNYNPETALDIGCGPGFTTDMLFNATKASSTYGIDNSRGFLETASRRFNDYNFIEHDVTQIPLPLKSDIMYTRFVLSHLKNTVSLINAWSNQLSENGLLFIEELEEIKTGIDVFEKYLSTNEKIISTQGAKLYIGQELSKGIYYHEVICNEKITWDVPDMDAARWFYPNTQTVWKDNEIVHGRFTQSEIDFLSNEILRISETDNSDSNITWTMRRLVIERI